MPIRLETRSTWRSTGKPGDAERVPEHHVRGLAADAGELDERLHRRGDLAAVVLDSAVAMPRSDFDLARKNPVGLNLRLELVGRRLGERRGIRDSA